MGKTAKKPLFQINSCGESRPKRRQGLRLPPAAAMLAALGAVLFAAAGLRAGANIRHLPEAAGRDIFEKPLSPLSEGLPPLGVYSLKHPLPLFLLKSGGDTCALPLEQPPRGGFPALKGRMPGFSTAPGFAFERAPAKLLEPDLPPEMPLEMPPEMSLEMSQALLQLSGDFKELPLRWQKFNICSEGIICGGGACRPAQDLARYLGQALAQDPAADPAQALAPNKHAGLGGVMLASGVIYFGACIAAVKIKNSYIAALCLPVRELLPYLPRLDKLWLSQ